MSMRWSRRISPLRRASRRVRRRQEGEKVEYFYTEKEFRTDRTCLERERAVTEEEYHRLLVRRREEA